jgi:hypothetical protein
MLQYDVEVFNVEAMLEEIKWAEYVIRFLDPLIFSKIFLIRTEEGASLDYFRREKDVECHSHKRRFPIEDLLN